MAERLEGRRPSRTKAILTAAAAALGTGVLVYKLLRSGDDDGNGDDAD